MMKKSIQPFALSLLLTAVSIEFPVPLVFEEDAKKETVSHFFPADLPEGLIGTSQGKPVDNPSDNVFRVC